MRLLLRDTSSNALIIESSDEEILSLAEVAKKHLLNSSDVDLFACKDNLFSVDDIFETMADYIESARK